jgi:hypothetical protein
LAWFSSPREEVLWLDVQRLDALWRRGPIYIPAFGKGSCRDRYLQIGEMIMAGYPVKMTEIGGDTYSAATGYIGFIDGTHRFSWIRDYGGTAIPVLIDREYCIELKRPSARCTLGSLSKLANYGVTSHSRNDIHSLSGRR